MEALAGGWFPDGRPVAPDLPRRLATAMTPDAAMGPALVADGLCLQAVGRRRRRVGNGSDCWDKATRDGTELLLAGRLFNGRDLAEERSLPAPASDAEVMLAVWLADGLDGFGRVDGRYVVAVWHAPSRRLTLAVDPMGYAQAVFTADGDGLQIAGEAKSLVRRANGVPPPDPTVIARYLTVNRYHLAEAQSFFAGIEQLGAGEALIADARGPVRRRYWDVARDGAGALDWDEDRIVAHARGLMLRAVERRMPEQSGLGADLSGGFDSSSVVCMMRHLEGAESARAFRTISFNFGSDEADEADLIDAVSRACGTTHSAANVLESDFLAEMDDAIALHDGPPIESGVLLFWKVKSLAAALGIEVTLSGLGGDELFMGRLNFLADLLRRGRLTRFAEELRAVYPVDPSTGKRTSLRKILTAYVATPLEPTALKSLRKRRWQAGYPPPWIRAELVASALPEGLPGPTGARFASVYDQDNWEVLFYELRAAALRYHDLASVGTGVETRFPLLDLDLVAFMARVPRELKISRGEVRRVQKRAMHDLLPPPILADHLKKDFHPVLDAHLRAAYGRRIEAVLAKKERLSEPYVDWKYLRSYAEAYGRGRGKPYPLWLGLALERWLEMTYGAGASA
jgi:asparagine synthase (glutamine-hydrolysing)